MFKPGAKLPPERTLVKQLDVSRTSLREALRVLETLGLVEVRLGRGFFVANQTIGRALQSNWSTWLSEHKQEIIHLHEVREGLEPKAAALAAERISEEEIEELSRVLAEMEESFRQGNLEKVVQVDVKFHDLIIQATRNPFLIYLGDSINCALIEARYAIFGDSSCIRNSMEEHRRIAEALRRRDATSAAELMMGHIRRVKDTLEAMDAN